LSLIIVELWQRGDRRGDEGNAAAVQVGNDRIEVIGDQGASGAALAFLGEPSAIAEHEVIDEQLRAPSKQVCQRCAPLMGLESILLVDPNPRQLLPSPSQFVPAAHELLLGLQQLAPRR
jgi:hypothetical protein